MVLGCQGRKYVDTLWVAVGVSGAEYAFIPDSVFDDLVATQFNYTVEDECEGTTHLLDDFWT